MALATQCPHCHTTFRVANDQLKLHGGLVRCGSCQQTFNGIEHLLAPAAATPAATPPAPYPTATPVTPTTSIDQIAANPTPVPGVIAPAPAEITAPVIAEQASEAMPQEELGHIASAEALEATSPEALVDKAGTHPPAIAATADASSEPPSSVDDLDFDMGVEDLDAPSANAQNIVPADDTLDDEKINQVELETRIALMDEPSWSATEASGENEPATDGATESDSRQEPHLDNSGATADDSAHDPRDEEVYSGEPEQHLHDGLDFDTSGKSDSITDELSQLEQQPEHEAELPGFVIAAEKNKGRRRWIRIAMIVLSLLMLLSLSGQMSYSARNQIAAWLPQTKPVLIEGCKLLKCQISLPAQIDQISIESNELQALSAARNVFTLAVQLQNKGSLTQEWPMLELVLNDAKDKPVLRKVFVPSDYLNNKNDLPKGFSPSSEQSVKLYFELSDIKAAGYHVSIFYP
ncbi:DUF3426 domain-containing protein [Undibacterium sp. RuTC16W]|uniref:DUF3426 domain-containing protein n=1 Tax=Undibacterium sp. RuTC16W TaxID=3413048 RepID=UPI003BF1D51A